MKKLAVSRSSLRVLTPHLSHASLQRREHDRKRGDLWSLVPPRRFRRVSEDTGGWEEMKYCHYESLPFISRWWLLAACVMHWSSLVWNSTAHAWHHLVDALGSCQALLLKLMLTRTDLALPYPRVSQVLQYKHKSSKPLWYVENQEGFNENLFLNDVFNFKLFFYIIKFKGSDLVI